MPNQPLDDIPLPQLPPRRPDSHKGDFGRALLIGGSRGMTGAIALAGMAALRSGAGLVKLAVPSECLPTVAAHEPSYMTVPLPGDGEGRIALAAAAIIRQLVAESTALALGPGLGRSDDLTSLVGDLYASLDRPLVVDADGLTAISQQPTLPPKPAGARILTPHPGEFARLAGIARLDPADRASAAVELAGRWGVVLVLKGHGTIVTDGQRMAINTTGNPGMATGGSGDVLTGIIVALLCQGLSPLDAARLGAHVHGLAGDLAVRDKGQIGLIARDLVEYLPQAWLKIGQIA